MHLEKILHNLRTKKRDIRLCIPGLWKDAKTKSPLELDYISFLIDRIEDIISSKSKFTSGKDWTREAVIYNIFVRFFSAYDHDRDGMIGQESGEITLNNQGIRETGTFLKTIILLPYLKKLGINTIHLLPITKIGIEGRKGDMGSPYAIKDPFHIDPNLADPIINISLETQYKGLIEAAHTLGIRVVQEFIFRTASIDSDWSHAHPDWFYWINKDKKYGAPKFEKNELEHILKVPKGKGKYIPPSKSYRRLFHIPTAQTDFSKLKIASAFADWPPDDLQPPWSDVTYLRLFYYNYQKENNYNYIAYNTIRYYDPELAKKEHINQDLWARIADIIPYYQKTFGIDGAMIDMGHALPNELKSKIIKRARSIDANFAFWDENFDNKDETKKDGYNAVIGDSWYKITKRNGFRKIILSSNNKYSLPFFGAAETHNSPRFGYQKAQKKKASWLLFNILPGSTPFLHNGFELNEFLPVNTGLNFSKKEIDFFSNQKLALFNKSSLNWNSRQNIIPFILKIAEIKTSYPWIFDKKEVQILETSNKKVLGFRKKHKNQTAIILFNTNFYASERFSLQSDLEGEYLELLSGDKITLQAKNTVKAVDVILSTSC